MFFDETLSIFLQFIWFIISAIFDLDKLQTLKMIVNVIFKSGSYKK